VCAVSMNIINRFYKKYFFANSYRAIRRDYIYFSVLLIWSLSVIDVNPFLLSYPYDRKIQDSIVSLVKTHSENWVTHTFLSAFFFVQVLSPPTLLARISQESESPLHHALRNINCHVYNNIKQDKEIVQNNNIDYPLF
jgi:hypothetical protein